MPYLQRIRSKEEIVVPLGKSLTVIGRAESCDVTLEGHSEISREHCAVHSYEDGTVKVVDLGSKNGTWVNGARTFEGCQLKDGDIVRLSRKVEFRFTENEPEMSGMDRDQPSMEEMTIAEDHMPRSPGGRHGTALNVRTPSEDLSAAASHMEKELEQQDFKSIMQKLSEQAKNRPKKKKTEEGGEEYW